MNQLYPIFLKTERLHFLIVGGGFVGEEKLRFLLKSSPQAKVTIVSDEFKQIFLDLPKNEKTVLKEKKFDPSDLEGVDLVIAATNIKEVNLKIREEAKKRGKLINVADTPELCDFYLGGIVTKGNLKVAISTNGKSPTLAKRFRQLLEEVLPDDVDELLENLQEYRKTLSLDFDQKVDHLNELTKGMLDGTSKEKKSFFRRLFKSK